jgi:hypothetical protein
MALHQFSFRKSSVAEPEERRSTSRPRSSVASRKTEDIVSPVSHKYINTAADSVSSTPLARESNHITNSEILKSPDCTPGPFAMAGAKDIQSSDRFRYFNDDNTRDMQTPMEHFANLSIMDVSPVVSSHKETQVLRPGSQLQIGASISFESNNNSPTKHSQAKWSTFLHDLQAKDTQCNNLYNLHQLPPYYLLLY